MEERRLTVRDRIIIHLAGYSRFVEEFECPADMSQAGISRAIGKSRAHTTLELNRMKDANLVTERLAHVTGARTKRKTYNLTPDALVMERDIADHLHGMEIRIISQEGPNITNGQQAIEILIGELTISHIMAVDMVLNSNGIISIDDERDKQKPQDPAGLDGQGNETFDVLILQSNILSKKGQPRDALLMLKKALKDPHSDQELVRIHYSMAGMYRKMGDLESALMEIDRALAIKPDPEEKLITARCQMEKAMVLTASGNESEFLELLDAADQVFRQENSQIDLLRCGINQGIILRGIGEIQEAVSVLEDSLEHAERASLDRVKAYAMVNLTDLLNEQEKYEDSKIMASNARDIFRVLDEPLMLAASLFNLGEAQAAQGEKKEAIMNLDESISILKSHGISRIGWLKKYAEILETLGEPEKAREIRDKFSS